MVIFKHIKYWVNIIYLYIVYLKITKIIVFILFLGMVWSVQSQI